MRPIQLSLHEMSGQATVIGTSEEELRGALMQRDRGKERVIVLRPNGKKFKVRLVNRSEITGIEVSEVGVALIRTNNMPYKALKARITDSSENPTCLLLHTQKDTYFCIVPPGMTGETARDLLQHSRNWPERCILALVHGKAMLLGGEHLRRTHRPHEHRWNDRVSNVEMRATGRSTSEAPTLSAVG